MYPGSGDSSVVRAPDSWLKGCRFQSLQERQENFYSRVNFLCWLLFRYLFRPHVIAVALKRPGHSAKSAGGRLQLNTHVPYICGFAWSDMVHGCMVYTEHADTAAVLCGTSNVSAVSTPLWWIKKCALKNDSPMQTHMRAQWVCSRVENSATWKRSATTHRCCSRAENCTI